jgi:hypothetical protein
LDQRKASADVEWRRSEKEKALSNREARTAATKLSNKYVREVKLIQ